MIRKPLIFLLITYALSWTTAFVYFALGGSLFSPSFIVIAILFMFTPMLSAIIVQKVIYREKVLSPLGVSFRINKWFFVGWLLPPFIVLAATGVSLLMPGVEFSSDPTVSNVVQFVSKNATGDRMAELKRQISKMPIHPFWFALISGLIAGVTINAVAGFGEELGWRGLLQKELAWLGFWKSSWLIGLVWGVWHLPFIIHGYNYPGHPVAGVFMMILWTFLFAPLIAYVRLKARSVIAAAIMHGTLNAVAGIPFVVTCGGDSLTLGILGVPGILVLVLLNIGLFCLIGKSACEIVGQSGRPSPAD